MMTRTASRPIPPGRVTPDEALAFGLTLAVLSVVMLGLVVNWVAAALLAFTIFFYVVIYTMWLKRSTPQNIVIGGAAGAFPPIIGWAAVTGGVAVEPIVLFLIIFFWTPPHFWALSLYRTEDYARAGIPMLPVVAGDAGNPAPDPDLYADPGAARRRAVAHGLCRTALRHRRRAAGVAMIVLALRVRAERQGRAASKQMFGFSILYLFLLFAVLLADRLWGGLAAQAVSHFAA